MLDVFDFIVEKGGDPKKIKESQRRRYAPEEAVDEVITLYEDHRKSEAVDSSSSQTTVLILVQLNTRLAKRTQKSMKFKSKSA